MNPISEWGDQAIRLGLILLFAILWHAATGWSAWVCMVAAGMIVLGGDLIYK